MNQNARREAAYDTRRFLIYADNKGNVNRIVDYASNFIIKMSLIVRTMSWSNFEHTEMDVKMAEIFHNRVK